MSVRLRDRNRQIPNGLRFYQPETRWESRPWSSFNGIVEALMTHRKGNPYLAQKHGWATDKLLVEAEVDEFNAKICEANGWAEYIMQGGATAQPPFPPPRKQSAAQKLSALAVGGGTLVEWLSDGAEAVAPDLAERRARICAVDKGDGSPCSFNTAGDLTSFFTVPVSNKIRERLAERRGMNLSTPHDELLNVCDICLCPLKLKVHMPIDRIMKRLSAETLADLPPYCWMKQEAQ